MALPSAICGSALPSGMIPAQPGRCLGWMLIDISWPNFDLYVQPELLDTLLWSEIFDWTEKKAVARMQTAGMTQASVMTPEENLPACALYRSVGFEAVDRLVRFDKGVITT